MNEEDNDKNGFNSRLRPRKSNPSSSKDDRRAQKVDLHVDERNSELDPPEKKESVHILCLYCNKVCTTKSGFSSHVQRSHQATAKKDCPPQKCSYCIHLETEPKQIVQHMLLNHQSEYYACAKCEIRFSTLQEQNEHTNAGCKALTVADVPYRNKLRTNKISSNQRRTHNVVKKSKIVDLPGESFNGLVISCELKPNKTKDIDSDIEESITTNVILPPKSLDGSVLDKNAVILLDDIQRKINSNFSLHGGEKTEQILSRLGVVHRNRRVADSSKKEWQKHVEEFLKFERCFDTNFYAKVARNVQENLLRFLDGSFKTPPSDDPIKTRKWKNDINTVEGFPILLAEAQYSRNPPDGYLPRSKASKHKWKWDNGETERFALTPTIPAEKDAHTSKCIVGLVSSLDIWTQLCMRRKYDSILGSTSQTDKNIDKLNTRLELKEILESRELPSTSQEIVKYTAAPIPISDKNEFPSILGLMPKSPDFHAKPAVLSGECVRARCYVCCACGEQSTEARSLNSHDMNKHPDAQVTHYEIVGEHMLNADIFKHLYVPSGQVSNRTRPTRGSRTCTKCQIPLNHEDLHSHMLECAGDSRVARRKIRPRPFGVRRRRTRLPEDIQKQISRKIRNRRRKLRENKLIRPRQRIRTQVGDAETIRKMLADLPPKRHRPSNQGAGSSRQVTVHGKHLKRRPVDTRSRSRAARQKDRSSTSSTLQSRATKKRNLSYHQESHKSSRKNTTQEPKVADIPKRRGQMKMSRRKSMRNQNKEIIVDMQSHEIDPTPDNVALGTVGNDTIVMNPNEACDLSWSASGGTSKTNNAKDFARNSQTNNSSNNINPQRSNNVPLKHSIASLTASTFEKKGSSFDSSLGTTESFLNGGVPKFIPSVQPQLMMVQNEAYVAELDKPPLSLQIDSFLPKAKSKTKKGLNDCIAMLKGKLGEPSNSARDNCVDSTPNDIQLPSMHLTLLREVANKAFMPKTLSVESLAPLDLSGKAKTSFENAAQKEQNLIPKTTEKTSDLSLPNTRKKEKVNVQKSVFDPTLRIPQYKVQGNTIEKLPVEKSTADESTGDLENNITSTSSSASLSVLPKQILDILTNIPEEHRNVLFNALPQVLDKTLRELKLTTEKNYELSSKKAEIATQTISNAVETQCPSEFLNVDTDKFLIDPITGAITERPPKILEHETIKNVASDIIDLTAEDDESQKRALLKMTTGEHIEQIPNKAANTTLMSSSLPPPSLPAVKKQTNVKTASLRAVRIKSANEKKLLAGNDLTSTKITKTPELKDSKKTLTDSCVQSILCTAPTTAKESLFVTAEQDELSNVRQTQSSDQNNDLFKPGTASDEVKLCPEITISEANIPVETESVETCKILLLDNAKNSSMPLQDKKDQSKLTGTTLNMPKDITIRAQDLNQNRSDIRQDNIGTEAALGTQNEILHSGKPEISQLENKLQMGSHSVSHHNVGNKPFNEPSAKMNLIIESSRTELPDCPDLPRTSCVSKENDDDSDDNITLASILKQKQSLITPKTNKTVKNKKKFKPKFNLQKTITPESSQVLSNVESRETTLKLGIMQGKNKNEKNEQYIEISEELNEIKFELESKNLSNRLSNLEPTLKAEDPPRNVPSDKKGNTKEALIEISKNTKDYKLINDKQGECNVLKTSTNIELNITENVDMSVSNSINTVEKRKRSLRQPLTRSKHSRIATLVDEKCGKLDFTCENQTRADSNTSSTPEAISKTIHKICEEHTSTVKERIDIEPAKDLEKNYCDKDNAKVLKTNQTGLEEKNQNLARTTNNNSKDKKLLKAKKGKFAEDMKLSNLNENEETKVTYSNPVEVNTNICSSSKTNLEGPVHSKTIDHDKTLDHDKTTDPVATELNNLQCHQNNYTQFDSSFEEIMNESIERNEKAPLRRSRRRKTILGIDELLSDKPDMKNVIEKYVKLPLTKKHLIFSKMLDEENAKLPPNKDVNLPAVTLYVNTDNPTNTSEGKSAFSQELSLLPDIPQHNENKNEDLLVNYNLVIPSTNNTKQESDDTNGSTQQILNDERSKDNTLVSSEYKSNKQHSRLSSKRNKSKYPKKRKHPELDSLSKERGSFKSVDNTRTIHSNDNEGNIPLLLENTDISENLTVKSSQSTNESAALVIESKTDVFEFSEASSNDNLPLSELRLKRSGIKRNRKLACIEESDLRRNLDLTESKKSKTHTKSKRAKTHKHKNKMPKNLICNNLFSDVAVCAPFSATDNNEIIFGEALAENNILTTVHPGSKSTVIELKKHKNIIGTRDEENTNESFSLSTNTNNELFDCKSKSPKALTAQIYDQDNTSITSENIVLESQRVFTATRDMFSNQPTDVSFCSNSKPSKSNALDLNKKLQNQGKGNLSLVNDSIISESPEIVTCTQDDIINTNCNAITPTEKESEIIKVDAIISNTIKIDITTRDEKDNLLPTDHCESVVISKDICKPSLNELILPEQFQYSSDKHYTSSITSMSFNDNSITGDNLELSEHFSSKSPKEIRLTKPVKKSKKKHTTKKRPIFDVVTMKELNELTDLTNESFDMKIRSQRQKQALNQRSITEYKGSTQDLKEKNETQDETAILDEVLLVEHDSQQINELISKAKVIVSSPSTSQDNIENKGASAKTQLRTDKISKICENFTDSGIHDEESLLVNLDVSRDSDIARSMAMEVEPLPRRTRSKSTHNKVSYAESPLYTAPSDSKDFTFKISNKKHIILKEKRDENKFSTKSLTKYRKKKMKYDSIGKYSGDECNQNNSITTANTQTTSTDDCDHAGDSDASSKSDVPLTKYVDRNSGKSESSSKQCTDSNIKDSEIDNYLSKKNSRGCSLTAGSSDETPSINEEKSKADQFMESFGFFSEKKPRKSNLLAAKKIFETFHESDEMYFRKRIKKIHKSDSKKPQKDKSKQIEEDIAHNVCTKPFEEEFVIKKKSKKKMHKRKERQRKTDSTYCAICQKNFRRPDNFLRHKMTLLHISKLSELEMNIQPEPRNEEPNYLLIYKEHFKKFKKLTEKYGREQATQRMKSFEENLAAIKAEYERRLQAVRNDQDAPRRDLSRDEELFLNCCELLREAHKSENVQKQSKEQQANKNSLTDDQQEDADENDSQEPGTSRSDVDDDVDSITAKNILESEEVRTLEQNLIFDLAEAAIRHEKENNLQDESKYDSLQSISDIIDENTLREMPSIDEVELQQDVDSQDNLSDEYAVVKEKNIFRETPEIDMFEDKFDKIKRKCRSQAAAAKNLALSESILISQMKKANSKKANKKKKSRKVLTKAALKGFDSVKSSMQPAARIDDATLKKRKKHSTDKKKKKEFLNSKPPISVSSSRISNTNDEVSKVDVYEFMDNDESDAFGFQSSSRLDRFKNMRKISSTNIDGNIDLREDSKMSDVSASDGDDFVYMSDDYVCSADETENSILSCELSSSKFYSDKKGTTKRKDALEKNAVMGKIFKNNAVRPDRRDTKKVTHKTSDRSELDQLFDSLLVAEAGPSQPRKDSAVTSDIQPSANRLVDSDSASVESGPSAMRDFPERERRTVDSELNTSRNTISPEVETGVAHQRARRKCTVGKQNVLAETWSSESEQESCYGRNLNSESTSRMGNRKRRAKKVPSRGRLLTFKDTDSTKGSSSGTKAGKREKRHKSEVGYTWELGGGAVSSGSGGGGGSSGSGGGVNSAVEEPALVEQHGWIVGDSHKKLVTMLAHAKGRRRDEKRSLLD